MSGNQSINQDNSSGIISPSISASSIFVGQAKALASQLTHARTISNLDLSITLQALLSQPDIALDNSVHAVIKDLFNHATPQQQIIILYNVLVQPDSSWQATARGLLASPNNQLPTLLGPTGMARLTAIAQTADPVERTAQVFDWVLNVSTSHAAVIPEDYSDDARSIDRMNNEMSTALGNRLKQALGNSDRAALSSLVQDCAEHGLLPELARQMAAWPVDVRPLLSSLNADPTMPSSVREFATKTLSQLPQSNPISTTRGSQTAQALNPAAAQVLSDLLLNPASASALVQDYHSTTMQANILAIIVG